MKFNLIHIAEGWGNAALKKLGKLDPIIEVKAAEKLAVCNNCFIGKNVHNCTSKRNARCAKDHVYFGKMVRYGQSIKGCGCPKEAKVLSESDCPRNYFYDWDVRKELLEGIELDTEGGEPLIYGKKLSEIKYKSASIFVQNAIDRFNFLRNG